MNLGGSRRRRRDLVDCSPPQASFAARSQEESQCTKHRAFPNPLARVREGCQLAIVKGDLLQRYSLDFLSPPASSTAVPSAAVPASPNVSRVSRLLLKSLEEAGGRAQVYDLIKRLEGIQPELQMETVLEAVQRLQAGGLVEIEKVDRLGNHLVALR